MSRTPADYSLTVVRGATWEDEFTYVGPDGVAIDLTGYQARMQVRTKEGQFGTSTTDTLVMELTTDNGLLDIPVPEDGQVLLKVAADDTLELNPDNQKKRKLVYSLDLFRIEGSAPEYVIPLVKGSVTVMGATTR
ncbi:MAG TPA: hypothetical protein VGE09_06580 [Pseudoxanthomonas sp.]